MLHLNPFSAIDQRASEAGSMNGAILSFTERAVQNDPHSEAKNDRLYGADQVQVKSAALLIMEKQSDSMQVSSNTALHSLLDGV
jgi:hypothetical protein